MQKKYDITGKQFGYLTVIKRDESSIGERNSKWICKCKCGNVTSVCRCSLVDGHTTSCGCKHYESHNKTHGMTKTRLYGIWNKMKYRCNSPNHRCAKSYYFKGITVCKEWENDFVSFYNWAISNGYNENLTIDRIDNAKGYCPENCRWVTMAKQQINKTNTVKIEYNGEKIPLSVLARRFNVPYKRAHKHYMNLKKKGLPLAFEKIIY